MFTVIKLKPNIYSRDQRNVHLGSFFTRKEGGFVRVGFCPGGVFFRVGFCPGGVLSRGGFVRLPYWKMTENAKCRKTKYLIVDISTDFTPICNQFHFCELFKK